MNFVEELTWRGMIRDIMPGTKDKLKEKSICGYVGFDPTASSLQIGNLVAIMLLVHFQRSGHTPIVLVGSATGMIGDPSGKSEERKLLSPDEIRHNADCFKKQLAKFLDFGTGSNRAEMVNNDDWFNNVKFLDFLRDVGKHLTLNYMIAKDSVQSRLESGISFTEFSYQLLQAYDFYWLFTNKNCVLQMGGSDQWGNITAGCELIRRKAGGEAFALTCPLLTKADGTKFGKSEAGEKVWLDPSLTSPYRFYQFWLNCTDDDARRFIKTFTLLSKEEIDAICGEHDAAPHVRPLQKALAKDITIRVHSKADWEAAVEASSILFGEGTAESLKKLSEKDLLSMFEGVPQATVARTDLEAGVGVVDFLSVKCGILASKGEAKRLVQNGGVFINKSKVANADFIVKTDSLLNGKYILVQKGKKNYVLVNIR
ncbi:MAG TPA: tyrosine--tRNA ligase [Chitinivibrionales bacterium]|jgi:tyrosyl-tRNA synthetase|nr:tyrosine--tRNA ligase [Chitinivibrionales bacterium]